ncbi:SpoIIE family protein phosphatase [Streptomyces sp. SKN60]|uniref:SpoIIE family protein phosphatase n=1 Tax=Streptomyces sp. SKN60 TaxID=2855506 RepID=UPI00224779E2|nr:SpoIIE family protein phosphatase [Streptomyces sp. SKN60]
MRGTRRPGEPEVVATVGDAERGAEERAAEAALLDALFTQAPVGLFLVDPELRVTRFNHAAHGMRQVPEERVLGHRIGGFAPGLATDELISTARRVLETGESALGILLRGRRPGGPDPGDGEEIAVSASLFRLTDSSGKVLGLAALAENVTDREQALARLEVLHRAHRRIGTSLDETATAEQLAAVAVPDLADVVIVDVLGEVSQGRRLRPGRVGPGSPLRRAAFRAADGSAGDVAPGALVELPFPTPCSQALADLRPRLVPRLAAGTPGAKTFGAGAHSLIAAPLVVHDTALGIAVFLRTTRPEPFDGDDLQLAEQLATLTALGIDKAHAYTRERTVATALQRRLLPSAPPELTGVEAAHVHLPGDDGADWFDVIPLSGARVGLTVGTVAGRGIEAAATMGQLRTAARALAARDPAPDELLSGLDEVTVRLAREVGPEGGATSTQAEPPSATCLYLVYDPVSGRCRGASAGHPVPLVLGPDGRSQVSEIRPGPPLGGGGGFSVATAELAEGSLLALYSAGLVLGRGRSAAEGRATLRTVLGRAGRTPAELCDDVVYALGERHDPRSVDDASLLLVRTRRLGADRIAEWPLRHDPTVVAEARALAVRKLADWGLDELADATELIVSELVTNAIRYGLPPLSLRMLRDRELICEVTDGSSTTPHMRLAEPTDEGGRGLFLVMHLAGRWGTRFAARGKTIWATQELPRDEDSGQGQDLM